MNKRERSLRYINNNSFPRWKYTIIEKNRTEKDLKMYPFWLLRIATPGLGSPTMHEVKNNFDFTNDYISDEVIETEFMEAKVQVIEYVSDMLQKKANELINLKYFEDTNSRDYIIKKLNLTKRQYYNILYCSLEKYAVALGHIKSMNS